MSQHLTSLERESELSAIVMNNDLYEKKCVRFKRLHNSIGSMISQLETGSLQVKRMATISEEKRLEMKEDVEKQQRETHSFVQDCIAQLNSAFGRVEMTRSSHRTLDIDNPALSITLPYDEWIQRTSKKQEKLCIELATLSEASELLKTDREELKRRSDMTSKAMGKATKDAKSLKEEITRQELGVAELRNTAENNKRKLQQANDERAMEEKKKAEAENEIIDAEKVLNDLQKIHREMAGEEEMLRSKLDRLECLESKLTASTEFDPQLVSELPDHDEINKIVDKWGALASNRKELNAALPQINVLVLETDTVDSLQVLLGRIQDQVMELQNEIEEAARYKKKFIIADELLSRKNSGYVSAVKQVEANRKILDDLKAALVVQKPASPKKSKSRKEKEKEALRQLEASHFDIPQGPTYKPSTEDFSTPRNPVQKEPPLHGKSSVQLVKQSSIESDFTRPINPNGSHYPGIQIYSQDAKNPTSKRVPSQNYPVEDESLTYDTSIQMDDTGTTQDASLMNGFFSPLKNNVEASPEKSPVVEFSMAEHMNEFNKRQAEKKTPAPTKPLRLMSERPFDDVDDADSSLRAPDADEDVINLSDDDDDDVDEEEDDLWANDSANLDQSVWGDD